MQTGRYTGLRGGTLLWYIFGGFRFVCDFIISDTSYGAGCQNFFGLGAVTTDLPYGGGPTPVLVSTLTNVIGLGNDTGDTNLQIIHNDATGICTKVDLGAGFPSNRTAGAASTTVYSIELYNAPGSNEVKYRVRNKSTGGITLGTDLAEGTLTTNLPLNTQALNIFASRAMNGPVTSTGQFDLIKMGVYNI